MPGPGREDRLGDLRSRLNTCLDGLGLSEVPTPVADLPEKALRPTTGRSRRRCSSTLLETLVEKHEEKVVFAGASNLTLRPTSRRA